MFAKLRFLITLAAAAALASMITPVGGAATVSLEPLGPCCFQELPLHYNADPGETNDVQIFMTVFADGSIPGAPAGTWIVVDNGAPTTAGAGCTSLDSHTVKCSEPPGSTELYLHAFVNLGDMNDSLHSESACGTIIVPEEDLCGVTGDGGDGDDWLYSPAVGYSMMSGGSGADRLFAGTKGTWDPSYNSSTLLGGTGNDRLAGHGQRDRILGGPGNDLLRGNAGNDYLAGRDGNDVVGGGVGRDTVQGGSGNDELWARDGFRDVVRGGSGSDRARRDAGLDSLYSIEAFF
jgi:Ca2+-binding RTX toxin-like protein